MDRLPYSWHNRGLRVADYRMRAGAGADRKRYEQAGYGRSFCCINGSLTLHYCLVPADWLKLAAAAPRRRGQKGADRKSRDCAGIESAIEETLSFTPGASITCRSCATTFEVESAASFPLPESSSSGCESWLSSTACDTLRLLWWASHSFDVTSSDPHKMCYASCNEAFFREWSNFLQMFLRTRREI